MSVGKVHDGAFSMDLERASRSGGGDGGSMPEPEVVDSASGCFRRAVPGLRFAPGKRIETVHACVAGAARSPRIGAVRRDGGTFQLVGPVADDGSVDDLAEVKMQSGGDAVLIPVVPAERAGILFDPVMEIAGAAGGKTVDRSFRKIAEMVPAFPETVGIVRIPVAARRLKIIVVIACVGGGSNAIGLFNDFIDEENVKLIGVEPAGFGISSGKHGCVLQTGIEGIFFGANALNMQNEKGEIEESYSIAAGLDFPSVGPQHCYLQSIGRAQYEGITDVEALEAFMLLSLQEGIIPALESSHTLAYALKMAKADPMREQKVIVNLSGRGDKDIFQVYDRLKAEGILTDGHLSKESLAAFQEKYHLI